MTMCVAIKNLDLKSKSKANLPQVIKKRERGDKETKPPMAKNPMERQKT